MIRKRSKMMLSLILCLSIASCSGSDGNSENSGDIESQFNSQDNTSVLLQSESIFQVSAADGQMSTFSVSEVEIAGVFDEAENVQLSPSKSIESTVKIVDAQNALDSGVGLRIRYSITKNTAAELASGSPPNETTFFPVGTTFSSISANEVESTDYCRAVIGDTSELAVNCSSNYGIQGFIVREADFTDGNFSNLNLLLTISLGADPSAGLSNNPVTTAEFIASVPLALSK